MRNIKRDALRALLLGCLLTLLFTIPSFAASVGIGVGTVTASSLRMRTWDSTTASVVTKLSQGTVVTVLDSLGDWYQVSYNDETGWVSSEYLTVSDFSDSLSTYGRVLADDVNVRSAPSTEADVVLSVKQYGYVSVKGFDSGWFYISCAGQSGYIRSDYLALTNNKSAASIPAGSASKNGSTYTIDATVADLLEYAQSFLGVPYKYGGTTSGGFDCSGFTMYIYKHFGISLPHSATSQLSYGIKVSLSELQPGDLVFFRDTNYSTKAASHVGIYIGDSKFIHASSSRSGKYVIISSLNEAYHASVFTSGRHLIEE